MKRHIETRARARQLRTDLTPPERALWQVLRADRLGVKFQRQVVLVPCIADFAARAERLVVELDGDSHAGREAHDVTRTAYLESSGWRVSRFTNADVTTNLQGVTRAILLVLGHDPCMPRPLQGERDRPSGATPGRGGSPKDVQPSVRFPSDSPRSPRR